METNCLANIRRWPGDSKRWLDKLLHAASSDPRIIAIVPMGSAIRERGHRRSDFDLLIMHQGARPKLEPPIEVDIRFVDIEHVDEKIRKGEEVLCWALKFAAAIYDPQCAWDGIQRIWQLRVPLPSAAEAKKRGKLALQRADEMIEAGDESGADDLLLAALTQFVRYRLIQKDVFPASRPELADQLRSTGDSLVLADLLDQAMYSDPQPVSIIQKLKRMRF